MAIKPRPLARRVQSQLYRSSLFALIILIGLSLLAGLYDMAQQVRFRPVSTNEADPEQFVRGNRITKNADTAIVAGAYVLTVRSGLFRPGRSQTRAGRHGLFHLHLSSHLDEALRCVNTEALCADTARGCTKSELRTPV